MPPLYWSIILFLSILWGASFFFVELGLDGGYHYFTIVFGRTFFGAVVIALYFLLKRKSFGFLFKNWRLFVFTGFFSCALPFSLFAWGQQYIDSSVAAILNSATPMSTLLIASIVGDEKLTWLKSVSLVIGVLGVGVIVSPAFGLAVSSSSSSTSGGQDVSGVLILLGTLAAALAAVCYGIGATFTHVKLKKIDSFEIALGTVAYAALFTLPLSLIFGNPVQNFTTNFDAQAFFAIFTLGILGTGIAQVLFFEVVQRFGATNATVVTFVVPVFAFLLGFFVLRESLGATFFIGAVLVITGLIFLDGRVLRWLKRPRQKPKIT